MKVIQLSDPPSDALGRALARFEAPFAYPLGPGKFFRISHGEDYTLFFRAQGRAFCFIAEEAGQVIGSLGTAIRQLWMPDGTERSAAYLCDLKIAPEARGGSVLLRLARAAETWLRPRVEAAFGIVMGGTSRLPDSYTGRAGIPEFQDLGKLMLWRITRGSDSKAPVIQHFLTAEKAGLDCYQRLSRGRYACPSGNAALRSEISPVWLMHPDGLACGMLEDTRKAKRLVLSDGLELLSAHLSCFAWNSVSAAVELIHAALHLAADSGLPAIFIALAEQDAAQLRGALQNLEVLAAAPAIVYGAGLKAGDWNINSSEI